ncbi:MAG: acyl-CoA thioesterase [Promethearchaeati archaeon]
MEPKPVSDSQVEISQIMMPPDANPAGNVFGGVIMNIIDSCALIVASRHTHLNCVTASVDRLDFLSPVFIGNVVIAKGSLNYVSRTSMEVGVSVDAECLVTGRKAHVASAYLTYVALDENDKPTNVPGLVLENDEQKKRFKEAEERRKNRIKKVNKKEPQGPCLMRVER